MFSSSEY